MHNDLKSQNIFLTKNNLIKLEHLVISKELRLHSREGKTTVGAPINMSPEIINNKPYIFASDIWSLGVLLYEMCCLRPPFVAPS